MLHKLVGLKWFTDVGLEILGISTIKELFTSFGIDSIMKKDLIVLGNHPVLGPLNFASGTM